MSGSPFDTIVAPITGPFAAPVAIVRLSGPESWSIASEVFHPWPLPVVPRLARYGHYLHGDDGLATPFDERSYTGEQSAELSLHGSLISIHLLMEACQRAGARPAESGEFSLRAFLNGQIDLTQAEAVADTVAAATEIQLAHANRIRSGALRNRINEFREAVTEVIAKIEAHVDFSEEIGEFDRIAAERRLDGLFNDIQDYIAKFGQGRLMREGIRVAIIGRPNVGKSSLLNALLGSERAIVSPIPGTTRDYLEETAVFEGWPVVFVDTAGIRHSPDQIEQIGVVRSHQQAELADIVLLVIDCTAGLLEEDQAQSKTQGKAILVANKCDLAPAPSGVIPVSALTGEGLPRLRTAILERVEATPTQALLVNRRQHDLLVEAGESVMLAKQILRQNLPFDLAVVHLNAATYALGKITGDTASENMLDEIFSRFCIGK